MEPEAVGEDGENDRDISSLTEELKRVGLDQGTTYVIPTVPVRGPDEEATLETVAETLLELFENACERMTLWLTEKRTLEGLRATDPECKKGYYILTTWPAALLEPATLSSSECDKGDLEPAYSVSRVFCCDYISMDQHRENTKSAIASMSNDDPLLFQMYQGDCFFNDMIEGTNAIIEEKKHLFKDVAPPFVGIYKLMSGPPHSDGSEYFLSEILSFYIVAPNAVLEQLASSEPVPVPSHGGRGM